MSPLPPPTPPRFSLRLRIGGAFAASFVCFAVALSFSVWQMQALGDTLRLLDRGYMQLARVAARLEGSLVRLDADQDRLRSEDPRTLAKVRVNLSQTESLVQAQLATGREVLAQALPSVRDEQDQTALETLDLQLQTIGAYTAAYVEVAQRALALMERRDTVGAAAVQTELTRARGNLRSEVEKLSARVETRIRQSTTRATREQENVRRISLGATLVALLVGVLILGAALWQLRPITELTRQVRALASGAVGVRVTVTQGHELGVLQAAFNTMAQAIEERDQQRARLARSERLALVGQMLAQITHEVRNPLNALSLNAELLAEDLDALPPGRREEAQQILATMTSEVRRLGDVTAHYLNLARRPMPRLNPADLGQLVRSLLEQQAPELRQAGVQVELRCPTPVRADVDPDQLRQVLLNLLRNSQEAGATRLTVTLEAEGADARVTVEDNGQGLPPDALEQAFEPFRTSKAQGSGLGLAITRQILEDHGGRAWAEPSPQGARIRLQWPLVGARHTPDDSIGQSL